MSELNGLLSDGQIDLLSNLLIERLKDGFGDVIIRVSDGKIRWIGPAYFYDADPKKLDAGLAAIPTMPISRRKRR